MNFEALVKHISTIQNTLQAQAAHAVNLALTSRDWLMGSISWNLSRTGKTVLLMVATVEEAGTTTENKRSE